MAEVHGQHEGRAERIRQTSDWLGASYVSDFGEPIVEDMSAHDADIPLAVATVEQIRIAISQGQRVRLGERHRPTLEAIIGMLSADERSWVICDLDNVMPPPDADQQDLKKTAPPAKPGRDLIRPQPPANHLTMENGGLRPLE